MVQSLGDNISKHTTLNIRGTKDCSSSAKNPKASNAFVEKAKANPHTHLIRVSEQSMQFLNLRFTYHHHGNMAHMLYIYD